MGSQETPRDERLRVLQEFGVVWATLNTSFDDCIANIKERRRLKGEDVDAPLNIPKLREAYGYLHEYVDEAADAGVRCVTVPAPHESSYLYVHDLLTAGGWTCSSASSAQAD